MNRSSYTAKLMRCLFHREHLFGQLRSSRLQLIGERGRARKATGLPPWRLAPRLLRCHSKGIRPGSVILSQDTAENFFCDRRMIGKLERELVVELPSVASVRVES